METQNPYAAPQSQPKAQAQQDLNSTNSIEFTPGSMTALLSTRSWLKFIAFASLFTAFTALVISLKFQEMVIFDNLRGIMLGVAIFSIIIPVVGAIYMYKFSGDAKKYYITKSAESFDSLAGSHSKLYIAIVAICIVSVLAFFYLVYFLVSKLQSDLNESRMRTHENNQYIEYEETP